MENYLIEVIIIFNFKIKLITTKYVDWINITENTDYINPYKKVIKVTCIIDSRFTNLDNVLCKLNYKGKVNVVSIKIIPNVYEKINKINKQNNSIFYFN